MCAVGAGAGGAAGTTAAKAERGALQKLQAAFDAKCEELSGVKDQLKESQVGAAGRLKCCICFIAVLQPCKPCIAAGHKTPKEPVVGDRLAFQ